MKREVKAAEKQVEIDYTQHGAQINKDWSETEITLRKLYLAVLGQCYKTFKSELEKRLN